MTHPRPQTSLVKFSRRRRHVSATNVLCNRAVKCVTLLYALARVGHSVAHLRMEAPAFARCRSAEDVNVRGSSKATRLEGRILYKSLR